MQNIQLNLSKEEAAALHQLLAVARRKSRASAWWADLVARVGDLQERVAKAIAGVPS